MIKKEPYVVGDKQNGTSSLYSEMTKPGNIFNEKRLEKTKNNEMIFC